MQLSAFPSRVRWVKVGIFLLAAFAYGWVLPEFNPLYAQDDGGTKKNIVFHIIDSAGWGFGLLFLAVSICLGALCVLLAMDLRMTQAIPPGFVDEFTDTVNKRKFKEAFDMARNDPSFLARVLTAGMSRLQYGIEDARESAMNMLESIRSDKEQKNNYTAVIGTLGPMLGLVGTVYGMILAFMELGAGTQPNPSKLADAISKALVITLLGISLSVPAIFFNAFFRNRVIRISMDTGNIADDLLTQMYHNSKRPAGPATTTAPGVPGMTSAPDNRAVGPVPQQPGVRPG
jgi:biopolymer transport protein ExbB